MPNLDLTVLAVYLAAVIGCGFYFARRSQNAGQYMAAGRSLPGWAVGLSMFGSYISSISFLANPGAAFRSNWNAMAFSLATPLAALVAVQWFVPLYRRSGDVSAYERLERRFGRWARTYATVCFLLLQVARMGTIIYLMSIAVAPLTGWDVRVTILLTTAVMTFYTLAGGISAVVWIGALQSGVLISGTLICLAVLLYQTSGGIGEIARVGAAAGKFSLGDFGSSLAAPTFWVTFAFGFMTHLGNFGADQSYIQRYITARSEREARHSVWVTTWLYVPTAAVFFLIGTCLFVFYSQRTGQVADLASDNVFPHFIATELPAGLGGLVIAAIFAASMDSNLNSMATLTLCDIYKPYVRPSATERESMRVLYAATIAWGVASGLLSLAMIRAANVLDAWWQLAGMCAGGVLGLFLISLAPRRVDSLDAAIGVVAGTAVILWNSLPPLLEKFTAIEPPWRSPLHANLSIVAGSLSIVIVGFLIGLLRSRPA
jgi:solute:Na+ symporter, SSS family